MWTNHNLVMARKVMLSGSLLTASLGLSLLGEAQDKKKPSMAQESVQQAEKRVTKSREVSGTIIHAKTVNIKGAGTQNTVALLKTNKGDKRLLVDLGPKGEPNGIQAEKGKEIAVQGVVVLVDGASLLVANKVKEGGRTIDIHRTKQIQQVAQKQSGRVQPGQELLPLGQPQLTRGEPQRAQPTTREQPPRAGLQQPSGQQQPATGQLTTTQQATTPQPATGQAPPTGQPPIAQPPTPGQPPTTGQQPGQRPPTGAPPTGAPPTGAPPTGAPPTGAPPTGAPPTGAPPTGAPPTGVPPTVLQPPAAVPATGQPPPPQPVHL